jgi:hypothetical protein
MIEVNPEGSFKQKAAKTAKVIENPAVNPKYDLLRKEDRG